MNADDLLYLGIGIALFGLLMWFVRERTTASSSEPDAAARARGASASRVAVEQLGTSAGGADGSVTSAARRGRP